MDSDDTDAESPPQTTSLLRRLRDAALLPGQSKSELSADSDTLTNFIPFGGSKGEIEELGSGSLNPDLLKKTGPEKSADTGSTPTLTVSDMMTAIYSLNLKPTANDLVELTAGLFKDVAAKSRKNRSLPATSEKMEMIDLSLDEIRPALLANLEIGHDVAIAPNDIDMFPHNHTKDPCLTGAGLRNLGNISERFSRYKQDDAHEFLLHLWTKLSESHDRCRANESIIRTVFGGIINSKFTCRSCKESFKRAEEIYDMQLPIQNDSELTIAILSYTKGDVDFSCDSCGKQEGATHEVTFRRLPSIATFQLKRFGNQMKKIEKHVSFPLLLDMQYFTKLDEEDLGYQLYAVLVHEGSKLKGGHYYCFIRISVDEWIKFDDARVSKVEETEVLAQQAYILFYAKPGTPWFSDSVKVQKSSIASTSSQQTGASTSSQAPASDIDFGKSRASGIGGGSRIRGYHSSPLLSIKEKEEE